MRTGLNKKSIAVAFSLLLAVAVGFVAAPVGAETISVPIPETAVKGEPGSTVLLGSQTVDGSLQGRSCDVAVQVTNQVSEHPGNVLVITSGDSSMVVAGIEDVANGVTNAAGTLTLGSSINVSVKLGNSNITSLGSSLTVTCTPVPVQPKTPPVSSKPTFTG
ncbi:MAG: hypothetical protein ACRBK7_28340 [Acidimicrobiales bacterium]